MAAKIACFSISASDCKAGSDTGEAAGGGAGATRGGSGSAAGPVTGDAGGCQSDSTTSPTAPTGNSMPSAAPEIGRSFSERITARSIVFWSSRTLPGQRYERSACIACGEKPRMRMPLRRALRRRNDSAKIGISSPRSRSGGTWIGNTLRR